MAHYSENVFGFNASPFNTITMSGTEQTRNAELSIVQIVLGIKPFRVYTNRITGFGYDLDQVVA